MSEMPRVTGLTTVVADGIQGWNVRVKLDSGWKTVANHLSREKAEEAELAINQVMIEYRTRRNEWENKWSRLNELYPVPGDLIGDSQRRS